MEERKKGGNRIQRKDRSRNAGSIHSVVDGPSKPGTCRNFGHMFCVNDRSICPAEKSGLRCSGISIGLGLQLIFCGRLSRQRTYCVQDTFRNLVQELTVQSFRRVGWFVIVWIAHETGVGDHQRWKPCVPERTMVT